jgi:2-hydroxycyclohexanecarboxyl-CoA dehydrogenase
MNIKAGFIGLGSLGAPIARRLARTGFDIIACDIAPQMLEAFDEPGTTRERDPIATARQSEMLGVCVRTDEQLRGLAGEGALFAAMPKGSILILHSTVAPGLARELAAQAGEAGVGFIDAGVSGGGPAAIEGKLSLFVGGGTAVVERAMPWLRALGKSIAHLGPVGRGLEAKLLNNLVSIANYGMSAAILDLGDKLHFDREQLRQALMAGSAQGFALQAVPGLLRPRGPGAPGAFDSLYELLKKDVDHARLLAPAEDVSMAALLASCQSMLDRIQRAAAADGPRDGLPARAADAGAHQSRERADQDAAQPGGGRDGPAKPPLARARVALVTGAAAGIGRAIALRLAREGMSVGVLDLNLEGAESVADEINARGGRAMALGASIADRPQVTSAVAKLRAALGPVTVLINNAGMTAFSPFEELTDESWDRVMTVNLKGTFIVTQVVLPDMKAARWGRIVNISSSSAQVGTPAMSHYVASKGAIIALTRSLARELGPHGITVNNIPPGSVMNTLMSEANRDRMQISQEELIRTLPVRRTGEPEDIANACAWLVAEDSGYVTGQTIGVNGGRVMA